MQRDFDLNLIKVLLALLQEKNTYRAAEVLDSSQPAVSRSLSKLREVMGDPLFIRDKKGLKLTPKAEKLSQSLPAMYDALLNTFEIAAFDPHEYKGTVKISLNSHLAEIYGAKIYRHLSQCMPKLTIELLSWNEQTCHLIMADQIDIALNFLPISTPKSLYHRKISTLDFGLVGNKAQYEHIKTVNGTQLQSLPLVTVLIPKMNDQRLRVEDAEEVSGPLNIVLKSHHFRPLLDLVQTSNVLCIAPEKIMDKLDGDLFHYIKPEGFERKITSVDIGIMYNNKNRLSPIVGWFDQQLASILSSSD